MREYMLVAAFGAMLFAGSLLAGGLLAFVWMSLSGAFGWIGYASSLLIVSVLSGALGWYRGGR